MLIAIAGALIASSYSARAAKADSAASLVLPSERHLKNVRQLTFGGQNAEAYFSADESRSSFNIPERVFPAIGSTPLQWTLPTVSLLCGIRSAQALEGPPAGTISLRVTACYTPRLIWAARNAPRSLITLTDTSGRSILLMTFSPPAATAVTFANSLKSGYDAEATISRDGKKLSSHRCGTEISMSTP